jgi:pimeloyl-ACP methyl ester carboxylesterase
MEEADNVVVKVLRALEALPRGVHHKGEFVAALRGTGLAAAVVSWLMMSLKSVDGGYRFILEPEAMRALLTDYYAIDSWATLQAARDPDRLHFVRAGASPVVSPSERERLGRCPLRVHDIANAGHWLHVDSLPQLVGILAECLPES